LISSLLLGAVITAAVFHIRAQGKRFTRLSFYIRILWGLSTTSGCHNKGNRCFIVSSFHRSSLLFCGSDMLTPQSGLKSFLSIMHVF
jgi:hypothetical protein